MSVLNQAAFKTHVAEMKWTLVECLVLIVLCALNSVPVMRARKRLFTSELLSQFSAAAEKETGKQPDKNGYPDMGDGRYGKALSLLDWITMTKTQRTHLNFVEQLPMLIFGLIGAALFDPFTTQFLGLAFIILRVAFIALYIFNPNLRGLASAPALIITCYMVFIIVRGLLSV